MPKKTPKTKLPVGSLHTSLNKGDSSKSNTTVWKGPVEDGITFSLLTRFLECRERFRLKVVEGLEEDEGFNHKIEWGSMFHEMLEKHSNSVRSKGRSYRNSSRKEAVPGRDANTALKAYCFKLHQKYPEAETEIAKWGEVCRLTFPQYLRYWSQDKDYNPPKATSAFAEMNFRVPYTLPSGRSLTLRGKIDGGVLLHPSEKQKVRGQKPKLYLLETKTKGYIDEEGITKTLDENLQTLFYYTAAHQLQSNNTYLFKSEDIRALDLAPSGVIYNVIKRPLSDKYSIRKRKTESEEQFNRRLEETIESEPEKYFMRWKIPLLSSRVQKFKDQCLHTILEQLNIWWIWILPPYATAPMDPWRIPNHDDINNCGINPIPNVPGGGIHFRAPWGVYNSLASGFRGSYFNLLTSTSKLGLRKVTTLFPELEES